MTLQKQCDGIANQLPW